MNRILATILATLNALLGFVLIFGSIWFAKFMYEQIATQQIAADMVSQAQIIMIVVPVIGIVIAAYSCGAIAFLAFTEGHLRAIKEQGESCRPSKVKGRSEPNITA